MKKGIAALLCATMVLGLTACGSIVNELHGRASAWIQKSSVWKKNGAVQDTSI